MRIKVEIFYPRLKGLIGNPDTLELDGENIGQCLDALVKRFPAAGKLLFDERGNLRRQVYVYVNAESIYKSVPDAPVKDGDRLIIAALIAGG